MGIATHLGPWVLGTVRSTTGSTAGLVRNTGATIVAQTKTVNFNDAAGTLACALPAGSQILRASFNTTTTFDAASTITLKVSGTAVSSGVTITTGGIYAIAFTNSQAVGRLLSVGTTDVLVTYDLSVGASTAGIGTLIVEYIVRNADGTYVPTSFTGP